VYIQIFKLQPQQLCTEQEKNCVVDSYLSDESEQKKGTLASDGGENQQHFKLPFHKVIKFSELFSSTAPL
jgi:hypothetical protein